jgi:hypothetical protein
VYAKRAALMAYEFTSVKNNLWGRESYLKRKPVFSRKLISIRLTLTSDEVNVFGKDWRWREWR